MPGGVGLGYATYSMDLTTWYGATADELAARLGHAPALAARPHGAVHLAVLVEPFLSFVLDGSKTIESRFASTRVAPYRCVEPGDLVLLKRASGAIVAAARVGPVWFFRGHPRLDVELHQLFGARLRDDVEGFWDDRRAARYATLIQLDQVAHLSEPLACPKADRRGWVVLQGQTQQLSLFA